MGKQIAFLALPEDEKLLLGRALELGAHIIYGQCSEGTFPVLTSIDNYSPDLLERQSYLWIPGLPVEWFPRPSKVSIGESDAIELSRSLISPEGVLVDGRLFIETRRLVLTNGRPELVEHDERLLTVYAGLVRFIKRSFVGHKVGIGTVYIGPSALEWHRLGGRFFLSWLQGEFTVARR